MTLSGPGGRGNSVLLTQGRGDGRKTAGQGGRADRDSRIQGRTRPRGASGRVWSTRIRRRRDCPRVRLSACPVDFPKAFFFEGLCTRTSRTGLSALSACLRADATSPGYGPKLNPSERFRRASVQTVLRMRSLQVLAEIVVNATKGEQVGNLAEGRSGESTSCLTRLERRVRIPPRWLEI